VELGGEGGRADLVGLTKQAVRDLGSEIVVVISNLWWLQMMDGVVGISV
jgi:hypothetical protein